MNPPTDRQPSEVALWAADILLDRPCPHSPRTRRTCRICCALALEDFAREVMEEHCTCRFPFGWFATDRAGNVAPPDECGYHRTMRERIAVTVADHARAQEARQEAERERDREREKFHAETRARSRQITAIRTAVNTAFIMNDRHRERIVEALEAAYNDEAVHPPAPQEEGE